MHIDKIIDYYLEHNIFNYKEEDINKYVNVAGAIIIKIQKGIPYLLLIQRSKDDHFPLYWEIPRGKCDKGKNNKEEKIKPCLRRETKEETGLDIKPIKLIDKFSYYVKDEKRKSTQFNYLCLLKDPNQPVKLSKEHQDYKWVCSLGEVELMVLPEIKHSISKILTTFQKLVNYELKDTSEEIIEET